MAKILKNTTASDIDLDILGRRVPASGQLDLDTSDFARLASDASITELTTLINSGDIVVNDGVSDLSIADALAYIEYPDNAANIRFDNSSNGFTSDDVQTAIEEVGGARIQSPQFQFIGQMNFDQYLYSYVHSASLFNRRSGDASNGYRFGNSAPITSLYGGTVVSASASITGIAQSTGSPSASLELKFELWNVGFNSEGTKLGDIIFNIDTSSYTVGNFWNSSILTAFAENQTQNVTVQAGDLLGLKFIRQTGSDKVVAVTNTTVVLEIEGEA